MGVDVERDGKRGKRIALRAACSIGAGLLLLEAALHVRPDLLPTALLDRYPAHGVEFFRRGVLSETPVDGLPIPLTPRRWNGPPPADLIEAGIAPHGYTGDALRTPNARVLCDARGFPNREAYERADIVLVGDSFVVSGSAVEPPGLVVRLEERTKRRVYSLGVSGIGPLQEAWLVEHVALELEPKLVVWCFFGGNDLADAKRTLDNLDAGYRMRSDLPDYVAPPFLRLPGVVRTLLGGGARDHAQSEGEPLPPLSLALGGAAGRHAGEPVLGLEGTGPNSPAPTWFHPTYLARIGLSRAEWKGHAAWEATTSALVRTRDLLAERGAQLVVVYLPSKSEALVEFVTDVELLYRYLLRGFDGEFPLDAAQAHARLLQNRTSQSDVLSTFCSLERIPCWVATPFLSTLPGRGETGFLAADTHWDSVGQNAIVDPLCAFLAAQGLLDF